MLLEKYPNVDGEFIEQLLISSSSKIAGEDNLGILNVTEALAMGNDFSTMESDSIIQPKEIEQVETFDTDNIVSGCWSNSAHSDLVRSCDSGTNIIIMSTAASIVDVKYKSSDDALDDKRGNPFHGRHNYVVNLSYLYNVARNLEIN